MRTSTRGRGGITERDWYPVGPGESGDTIPDPLAPENLPRLESVSINTPVLVFALLALAVLATYLRSPSLFGHPGLGPQPVGGEPLNARTGHLRESELQREPG